MRYKLTHNTTIIRDDGANIPVDERNRDYRLYVSWLGEGNIPDPADPIPGPSWSDIRAQRNTLMASCDWTQLPDAVLSFNERQAWSDYRQALRDIPQSFASPDLVVWPVSP